MSRDATKALGDDDITLASIRLRVVSVHKVVKPDRNARPDAVLPMHSKMFTRN